MSSKTTTRNRDGYPTRFTRDDLVPIAGDQATLGRVAEYTIDGVRAGGLPYLVRGPSPHETRYSLKTVEFEIAARALAKLSVERAEFTSGERPDWTIKMDGVTIGAEVSEIDPSAPFTHRMADLNVALRDAVDADPSLPIACRYIAFAFGPRAFTAAGMTAASLPARLRRDILAELLRYLAAGTFATGEIRGYPALELVNMQVHVADHTPGHVSLELPATSFAPLGPLVDIFARVTRKNNSALKGYDRSNPLWLFLGITDIMGLFTDAVEAFGRSQLAAGPFARVIVSDGLTVRAIP